MLSTNLKQQLQALIGQAVSHQGKPCKVIEVLESEAALVLEAEGNRGEFQDNQYGDPGRRVAEVFTIPVFNEVEGSGFHPELLKLGITLRE